MASNHITPSPSRTRLLQCLTEPGCCWALFNRDSVRDASTQSQIPCDIIGTVKRCRQHDVEWLARTLHYVYSSVFSGRLDRYIWRYMDMWLSCQVCCPGLSTFVYLQTFQRHVFALNLAWACKSWILALGRVQKVDFLSKYFVRFLRFKRSILCLLYIMYDPLFFLVR